LSLHGIKGHEWLKGYRFMHKIVIKQKNIITTTWKLRVYQENEIKEKYFLSLIRRVYDKVFGEWSNALFDTKKCFCTKGPNN
jgi:RNase P/RNase MRP subunit POP5